MLLETTRRHLAAVAFAAAVFLCGGAKAQTIDCTGPTSGNCVPVVQIAPPARIGVGSGNAGYPPGSTPAQTSTTFADTAGGSVVLAGVAGQFTYICGFEINGLGATGATTVTPQLNGTPGNPPFNGLYTFPAGATVAATPLIRTYPTCLRATTIGSNISLSIPGAAGNTTTTGILVGYTQ